MMYVTQEPPDALLFITPECPHCPTVLQALSDLVKQGRIGKLEVINIVYHPQRAQQLGIRSAPWLQLGEMVFEGLYTAGELGLWADKALTDTGLNDYFAEQLKAGRLSLVTGAINKRPARLSKLLELVEDPEAELSVRIGVSAIVEDMAGRPELLEQLPMMEQLAASDDPRVRADACHFLAQTHSREVRGILERLSHDPSRSVSEVALDCLQDLALNP